MGDYGDIPSDGKCPHCGHDKPSGDCYIELDGELWRTLECFQRELAQGRGIVKEAMDKIKCYCVVSHPDFVCDHCQWMKKAKAWLKGNL